MRGTRAKGVVCALLILSLSGCSGPYRFRCTSKPEGAGVLVGDEKIGETPCNIEVARSSDAIQDRKLEFVFCLPDGRQRSRVVDLRGFKAPNPLAVAVAAPFLLAGAGLLALSPDDSEEAGSRPDYEQERRDEGRGCMTLLGLGTAGVGAGLCALLGGSADSLADYPVRVDFTQTEDGEGER